MLRNISAEVGGGNPQFHNLSFWQKRILVKGGFLLICNFFYKKLIFFGSNLLFLALFSSFLALFGPFSNNLGAQKSFEALFGEIFPGPSLRTFHRREKSRQFCNFFGGQNSAEKFHNIGTGCPKMVPNDIINI